MNEDPNVIKASELDTYDFGDPVAPEGFDPEARGYSDPSPGWHVFELRDFSIRQNKVYTVKGEQWAGNQLEPRFVIPEGEEEAGASVLDFLPLPGNGMLTMLANRWANFVRGMGIQLPPGKLIPAGFQLSDLLNGNDPAHPTRPFRRVAAEVILDEYEGKKRLKIKLFGYKPMSEYRPTGAPPPASAAAGAPKKGTVPAKRTVAPPPAASLPAEPPSFNDL
jgi:hypothetical protein